MQNANTPYVKAPRWNASLIKAYAVVDGGTRLALNNETALRGCQPACRKGCTQCCQAGSARASAVEMAGALWHLSRRAAPQVREAVYDRLAEPDPDRGCPFLIGQGCAVYSMRFLACRQMYVFSRPCAPGEEPGMSRRADVFTPMRQFALRAFSILSPHFGRELPMDQPFKLEAAMRELSAPVKAWTIADPALFLQEVGMGRPPQSMLAA